MPAISQSNITSRNLKAIASRSDSGTLDSVSRKVSSLIKRCDLAGADVDGLAVVGLSAVDVTAVANASFLIVEAEDPGETISGVSNSDAA